MIAYLVLFTTLFNAVCLYNVYFIFLFAFDFTIVTYPNAFYFDALSFSCWHMVCLVVDILYANGYCCIVNSYMFVCIMYIAFNQLVFLILCSCCILHMTGLCAFRRNSTLKHPILLLLLNPSFKSCIAIEANLNKDLQKLQIPCIHVIASVTLL